MRLTKKEIKKVTKEFSLGNAKSIKSIDKGVINYIYDLKTNKGEFIIKKITHPMNKWWRQRKELEIKVLDHLIKKEFPYKVPEYLKNKKGKNLIKFEKDYYQAYPKISGKNIKRTNNQQIKEIAKMLAIYHKKVKSLKSNERFTLKGDLDWVFKKYDELAMVKPKNKIDKLMKENYPFFKELLTKISKLKFEKDLLITHSDLNPENMLWNKNKLTGILDFENVELRPKAYDVAYVWRKPNQEKFFINEYKKHNKLSKKEENDIPAIKLFFMCNLFWWFYLGMEKRPDLKYKLLKRIINKTKKMQTPLAQS